MNLYFNPEPILVPQKLNVFSPLVLFAVCDYFHRRLRLDGHYDYTI